jgi:hypothetical protein
MPGWVKLVLLLVAAVVVLVLVMIVLGGGGHGPGRHMGAPSTAVGAVT